MLVSFDYQNKSQITKLADQLLKPARYLFATDTILASSQIPIGESKAKHVFQKYESKHTLPKTALAIALVIPCSIFGIVLKILSMPFSKENKTIFKEYKQALKKDEVEKTTLVDRTALIVLASSYEGSGEINDIKQRLEKSYKNVVIIKDTEFNDKEKTIEKIKKLGAFDFYALRKFSQGCYVFDAEGIYRNDIKDLHKRAENSTVMFFGGHKNVQLLEGIKKGQPYLQENFVIESPLL